MLLGGPLIGRERELAALEQLLASSRLLTVTGPGGCGKTRIALELADRLRCAPAPWQILIVELASARTAEQVVDALVRALGVRERGGRSPIEVLLDSVGGSRVLVVLDNCEQVSDAVAHFCGRLLHRTAQARTIVTSREPLGVSDEAVFRLTPLGVPGGGGDVAAVVRSDAGRYFVDRAAAADPGFALTPSTAPAVVRICHELDGLPLALGLAAARVDTLAVSDIADGLSRWGRLSGTSGGQPLPQHRSLRASLDWSLQLLAEPERVLLRRLAAFAGGWTAAAAHAVAGPETDAAEVRELMDSLEAKGLIVAISGKSGERWSFLQTVAEYVAEQLALDEDEREVRDRHMTWFQAFAAEADALLIDPHGHELIDEETANLRVALERAIDEDPTVAMEIVAALTRHWILAEHFEEARRATAAVLAVAGTEGDAGLRARVHCDAGLIGALSEDYEAAIANTMAGRALTAGLDDIATEARCLQASAMVLILTGLDPQGGLRSAHRAVELMRLCGDPLGLAFALVTVAMAEALCDRFDAVRASYDEFLTIPSACEHVRLRAWAELAAAWTEVLAGYPEKALAHADRAIELEGDWPSMTHFVLVSHRVHALARLGRTDEALHEGSQALIRAQASGALMAVPAIEMALAVTELVLANLEGADALARPLVDMPQLHTVALMREVLARIALQRGDVDEAQTQARELAAVAQRTGSRRHQAVADFARGCAAGLAGDDDRARDLLQSALAIHAELGLECGAGETLEQLALVAGKGGDSGRMARLAAAGAAARARLGCAPLPPLPDHLGSLRQGAIEREGAAAWDTAWAEGHVLALADAIAYARRARGPRDRPPVGWPSLTPAEVEVAQLAATGLSNPQIASQLFMSRSTVKMHLSNVYLKLRIGNRTELARAMAMRSAVGTPVPADSPY